MQLTVYMANYRLNFSSLKAETIECNDGDFFLVFPDLVKIPRPVSVIILGFSFFFFCPVFGQQAEKSTHQPTLILQQSKRQLKRAWHSMVTDLKGFCLTALWLSVCVPVAEGKLTLFP